MKLKTIWLLFVLTLFIVACGGGDEPVETPADSDSPVAESESAEPANTPEPEPTNTAVPEPTNTPEPEPTNTPLPEPTNTPEPEPTEDPAASAAELLGSDSLRFDDEVLGLAFSYPADWFAETIFGTLVFVTSTDINDESADTDETSGLIIIITPPEEGMTPDEMLNSAFEQMDIEEGEFTIVDGPTDVEVNGQDGVSILFDAEDGDDMLRGRVTAVPTDDAVFVFMGVMPEAMAGGETAEILDAIVQTAELGSPDFELAMEDGFDFGDVALADSIYALGEFGTVINIDSAETNVFTYTLAADTEYFFLSQPNSAADVVLKLVDANGDLIDEADNRSADGTEFLFVEVATGGEYQLVVEEFFGDQLTTSMIVASGEDAQSAELSDAAPEFELFVDASSAPHVVIVIPDDDTLDLVISGGLGLYADSGGIADFEQAYLAAGNEFTLLISDFSTVSGAFRYLVIEVDDSFEPILSDGTLESDLIDVSAALPIELDTTEIAQSDDAVMYQVSLEGGVDYMLLAEPTDEVDIVLAIYGADGVLLDDVDGGFDGDLEAILFSPSASDDYFVEVAGFTGATDAQVAVLTAQAEPGSAEFDGSAGQEVAVTLPASASQLLFIVLPSDELDIVLTDPAGDVIDENISGVQEAALLAASPDADQTVVISLYNDEAGTVSYLSVELPDSFILSE